MFKEKYEVVCSSETVSKVSLQCLEFFGLIPVIVLAGAFEPLTESAQTTGDATATRTKFIKREALTRFRTSSFRNLLQTSVYFHEVTPDEQIDAWVSADETWVLDNYDILASAYQHFLSNGEWPTAEQLIRQRARLGILDDRPQQVLDRRPLIPNQGPPFRPDKITMSVRHLVHFPEAEYLTFLIARSTRFAVILIGSDDDKPRLSREQMINQPPQLLPGSVALLPRFLSLMTSEHPRPFGGYSNSNGEWFLDINVVAALSFSNVNTINDFIECQRAIIKGNLTPVGPPVKEFIGGSLADASGPKDVAPIGASVEDRSDDAERRTPVKGVARAHHEEKSLLSRAFNNPWVVGVIVFLVIGLLFFIYADLAH